MQSIKNLFGPVKAHPLISAAVVILLILTVGVLAALVVSGGDDDTTTAETTATEKAKAAKKKARKKARARKVKAAPVLNTAGTLDVSRAVGRLAIAQARGRIKHPGAISVRVSAAPKQTTVVHYQLSCYKPTGKTSVTKVGNGTYRTKPPSIRSIPLPLSGSAECVVTVSAQLSKTQGEGRVKVAVVAG